MAFADHIALQRAVMTALQASSDLLSHLPDGMRGVAAAVHPDNRLPYLVIESTSSKPIRMQEGMLDDCEVVCAIYSEQPGGTQARALLNETMQILGSPLQIGGHRVVLQDVSLGQAGTAGERNLYRATCALRVVIEKEGA